MPKSSPRFDEVAGDLKKRSEEAVQSFGRAALETGRGPMSTLAGVALLGFAAGVAASLSRKAATEVSIEATGDWRDALIAEHHYIERLFSQISELGPDAARSRRAKLFQKLDKTLARHAFAEESVIYPTLSAAELEAEARALASEHFDIRGHLHGLSTLPPEGEDFAKGLHALRSAFAHHARREEAEIYPALHARLSPQQTSTLTRALAKRAARLA